MSFRFATVLALGFTACATPTPDAATSSSAPTASEILKEGKFGLVNAGGDTIIALAPLPEPTHVKAALCASGTYPVAHVGQQVAGDPQRAARQVAANFASLPGQVFQVTGQARGDETCYLAADSGLIGSLIPLTHADSSVAATCLPTWVQALRAARQRDVTNCWPMAAASDSITLIAAQFSPANDSIVASIVLMDSAGLFFLDFPAPYRGPDTDSRWRVDDQGVFHPEDFQILFLARRGAAWIMALTWAGAEGEDAYLEVSDSSKTFRAVTESYRYWVPE
jgi:hypothetical protein